MSGGESEYSNQPIPKYTSRYMRVSFARVGARYAFFKTAWSSKREPNKQLRMYKFKTTRPKHNM